METNKRKEINKVLYYKIAAIAGVAILVLGIAFLFILNNYQAERDKENKQQADKQKQEQVNQIKEELTNEELNAIKESGLSGTYMCGGDMNIDPENWTYKSIELKEDATATVVSASDAIGKNGVWEVSKGNGDIYVVTLYIEGKNVPNVYQVYDSYLIDISSIYTGHVEKSDRFASTFTLGDMKIDIFPDGTAKGEFTDTNEKSENKGLKYAMAGDYSVDDDCIDITLNMSTTRFLMFEFELPGYGKQGGIASLFFEREQ